MFEFSLPLIFQDIALALVRVLLVVTFIYEAQYKFKDLKGFAKSHSLPLPFAGFVAFAELLAGIAMLLGFLAQWAGVGIIVLMLGSLSMQIFIWKTPYWASKSGPEYDLIMLVLSLIIVVYGPGAYSIAALM